MFREELRMADPSSRIVVAITGASGVIHGLDFLTVLKELGYESHVVISKTARQNFLLETDHTPEQVEQAAGVLYHEDDLTAPLASGSFITMGMVVIPCTIKTASGIAHSYNANLIIRAADVTLKERRPLVLVVRESPLHQGHLQLLLTLASMGAIILPPLTAFYHKPETIQDMVRHTTGKVLDCFRIPHQLFRRWEGP
jgi:4-hydroxy-3-polyprenylbenzoate decarboxylase